MTEAVGLSVGASMFSGVQCGRSAATRHSVLTLFGHRPPELGVPSENPHLDERGLVVTGFVDRVGDPVGMIVGDGSIHRGEALVADALRAMQCTVTGGRGSHRPTAVAYPAHWGRGAVDALTTALTRGAPPVTLISDAMAACSTLQSERGLPARGVIALCDFGGTGTSVTLLDAAEGYRPIAPTLRHTDFSGDLIDHALLTHVMTDLSPAPSAGTTGTSALGLLNHLRAQCRGAKERLSAATVTALTVNTPGLRGDVRLTRSELDDKISEPLAAFVAALQEMLNRNGIRSLVALASVGGGANIPVITTTLSECFRVPVITASRPELAAAKGAWLRAARGPADDKPTAMAPAVGVGAVAAGLVLADAEPPSSSFRGLAWSEAHEIAPLAPAAEGYDSRDEPAPVRPEVSFVASDEPEPAAQRAWNRRPSTVVSIVAGVILLAAAIGIVAVADQEESVETPATPTAPPAQAAPPAPVEPPVAPPEPQAPPPPERTVVVAPPPITQAQAPAPQPPPAAPAPAPPVFTIPTIPPIPGLPFVFPPPIG